MILIISISIINKFFYVREILKINASIVVRAGRSQLENDYSKETIAY